MDLKTVIELAQRSVGNTYGDLQSGVMDRMGLEPKRSTAEMMLPALGIFGLGLAAGAALGVIFAPKRGEELRSDIKHRISEIREQGAEQLEDVRARGEKLLESGGGLLEKGEELIESALKMTSSETSDSKQTVDENQGKSKSGTNEKATT